VKLKDQKGFSLIEIVVAITILAFVSIGIMTFTVPVTNLWLFQKFQEGAANEGRLAAMRMVREIAQVKDDTSVSTAQAANFSFTNTGGDTITFGLNGTTLTRNEGNGAQTLAENISTLQFVYYDAAGNTLATPTVGASTNIRRVEASLQVSTNGRQQSYRSMVYLRNV